MFYHFVSIFFSLNYSSIDRIKFFRQLRSVYIYRTVLAIMSLECSGVSSLFASQMKQSNVPDPHYPENISVIPSTPPRRQPNPIAP